MSVSGDQEDLSNTKRDPLMDDFMEVDDGHRDADDRKDDNNEVDDGPEKSENRDTQAEEDKQDKNEDEIRAKRVFVGNLSFKTSAKILKEYMLKVGDVVKVDIFEDKNGNSKGFGLVEYTNADEAKKAIAEMNHTSLDGREIFVREDNAKQARSGPLLVKERKQRRNGSPRRSNSPRRRRHSRSRSRSGGRNRKHGEGRDRNRRRKSRSKSKSRSHSPRHRRSDDKRRERSRSRDERRRSKSRSKDRNRRSRSREDRKASKGGHQVIVKNMPWSVTWQQLKDAFKEYGTVLRADVPQDGSGRSKGYGYVKFEKETEATKAIGGMDGASFNGRKITVKMYND